jgi:glucose-1-phosphate cytidylyltransferase
MLAIPYDGFWAAMDTLKERSWLEDLYRSGQSPWAVWRNHTGTPLSQPVAAVEVPDVTPIGHEPGQRVRR